MFQLVYRSQSRLSPDRPRQELQTILNVARRNNAELDVTGALVLHQNTFVQFLEGPEDTVKALFAAIEEDTRHTDVTILNTGFAEHRVFEDWYMALVGDEGQADIPLFATRNTLAAAHMPKLLPHQTFALDTLREVVRA